MLFRLLISISISWVHMLLFFFLPKLDTLRGRGGGMGGRFHMKTTQVLVVPFGGQNL